MDIKDIAVIGLFLFTFGAAQACFVQMTLRGKRAHSPIGVWVAVAGALLLAVSLVAGVLDGFSAWAH